MYFFFAQVYGSKPSQIAQESLLGQLTFREMFYTVGATTANFDQMEGNAICRQIPWKRDEKMLEAWEFVSVT